LVSPLHVTPKQKTPTPASKTLPTKKTRIHLIHPSPSEPNSFTPEPFLSICTKPNLNPSSHPKTVKRNPVCNDAQFSSTLTVQVPKYPSTSGPIPSHHTKKLQFVVINQASKQAKTKTTAKWLDKTKTISLPGKYKIIHKQNKEHQKKKKKGTVDLV
jgi:hypothetical protein